MRPSAIPFILVAVERCTPPIPSAAEISKILRLTASETCVSLLLAEHKSNRETARELKITEHTARRHAEKILLKLGIHNRAKVRSALVNMKSRTDGSKAQAHATAVYGSR